MTVELRKRLLSSGVNVDEALKRFSNNETLFLKYLTRFPDDPTMAALQRAFAENDAQSAMTNAHTLKGLAGNLSLTSLYMDASRMNALLKSGQYEEAFLLLPTIEQAYAAILHAIKSLP